MNFQARQNNIVERAADDETMVYDLDADRAYLLNETSAFVWQLCDGKHDLAAIAKELARKTEQPANEDLVKLAIDDLRANNLLEETEQVKDFFTKTSRRKAIKQIGLATMIALPMVFSLTSPTAAHAASGGIVACQPCTTNSQCASGRCLPQRFAGTPNLCSNGTGSPTTQSRRRVSNANDQRSCATDAFNCCSNSSYLSFRNGSYYCYCG